MIRRKLLILIFAVFVFTLFTGKLFAVLVTIDADLNSVSPIYYDANSSPPYYPVPLDTGLLLNSGDFLEINAAGLWSNAPPAYNLIFGPDGNPNENIAAGYPGAGSPVASLLGKIGSSNYFFIGSNYLNYVSQSGVLYLGFNDTDFGNNTGSIQAEINIVPSIPEPSSLFLFGLSLFGFFLRTK